MPEILIQHPDPHPPRWARIDSGALRWVEMDRASAFPDADAAERAYESARACALDQARARLSRALAAGSLYSPRGAPASPREPRLSDYAPDWACAHAEPALLERARPEDALSPLPLWFARCEEGWLSGSRWSPSHFTPDLHEARPFFSRRGAERAIEALRFAPRGPVSLLQARLRFERVEPLGGPGRPDDLSLAIASSCEARELHAALVPPGEPSQGESTRSRAL